MSPFIAYVTSRNTDKDDVNTANREANETIERQREPASRPPMGARRAFPPATRFLIQAAH